MRPGCCCWITCAADGWPWENAARRSVLVRNHCDHYGGSGSRPITACAPSLCLTGFQIHRGADRHAGKQGKEDSYIFGFEELSYGYLSGSYVRDKDAVDGAFTYL